MCSRFIVSKWMRETERHKWRAKAWRLNRFVDTKNSRNTLLLPMATPLSEDPRAQVQPVLLLYAYFWYSLQKLHLSGLFPLQICDLHPRHCFAGVWRSEGLFRGCALTVRTVWCLCFLWLLDPHLLLLAPDSWGFSWLTHVLVCFLLLW